MVYEWTGRGPRKIFGADTETTTLLDDARVWAWGLASVDSPDIVEHGTSIKSLMARLSKINGQVYFHNLKFDAAFIIDHLMRHGYEHTTDQFQEKGTFRTLMSTGGKLFSVNIRFANGKRLELRDSYKKIPLRVKEIPKAFGLKDSKGEIDYHANRPVGYNPTPEEWSYIDSDVSIITHALKEVIDSGMTKLTVASDSLAEYKRIRGKSFKTFFPVLSPEVDDFIREAYRGGFTYADERFKGRVIESPGIVLDVNSLYPHVMRSAMLPYGAPKRFEGAPPDGKLSIFRVTFTAKLKPDHIPTIQVKRNVMFGGTEYQREIKDATTLHLTTVDWELYRDHYDIEVIGYHGGYTFNARSGMFNDYIDKFMAQKENSVGGKRQIAKLFLNSLYGKFATNPAVTGKIPVFENDRVRWIRGEEETRDPVYTAVGAFITAYAREITIRAAQENYGTFAYADTDSLHLLQECAPETIDVHPTRLGAWKVEYGFTKAIYMRAKAYMEQKTGGEIETHIAGVPVEVADELTFADMFDGNVLKGKLTPKTVPGGTVLVDTPFKLSFTETSC